MRIKLPAMLFRTTITDWLAKAMVETVVKAADGLPAQNDYCDNCSCESCLFVRSYRQASGRKTPPLSLREVLDKSNRELF